jgi:hypothetical protein
VVNNLLHYAFLIAAASGMEVPAAKNLPPDGLERTLATVECTCAGVQELLRKVQSTLEHVRDEVAPEF